MHLTGRVKDRVVKETEGLLSLLHFPNSHNSPGSFKTKSEPQSPFSLPHRFRDQVLGQLSATLLATLARQLVQK